MRRFLVLLMAFIASAVIVLPGYTQQGRYLPLGVSGANGSATALDQLSVKALGKGHVRFNSVTKPLKTMKTPSGKTVSYKVAVYDGNCQAGSVKLLKGEYHDAAGNALFSKAYPNMTFRAMAPGTVGRKVLDTACQQAGIEG